MTEKQRIDKRTSCQRAYNFKRRKKQAIYYAKWYKENGRKRADDYMHVILEWKRDHPKEANAHNMVYHALKTGKLKKPENCSMCHRKKKVIGHHSDYAFPLKVVWVCSSCHKGIHLNLLTVGK